MEPTEETTAEMLLSIVIPTCNRPDTLAGCLKRLLPQRDAITNKEGIAVEILVGDDSADGRTEETLLRDYSTQIRRVPGPRRGPAANRNRAANKAHGEWLIFLDDDVVPDLGLLEAFLEAIRCAAPNEVLEGLTYSDFKPGDRKREAPVNLLGGYLPSCNFAVRKSTFNQLDGFREVFTHWMEDADFHRRLKEAGFKTVFVEKARVFHPSRATPSPTKLALRWRARSVFERIWGQSVLKLLYWLPLHAYRVRTKKRFVFSGQALIECMCIAVLQPFWIVADTPKVSGEKQRR